MPDRRDHHDRREPPDDLMEYRVRQLEESHVVMAKTLQEIVIEFKSTKRTVVAVAAIVGMLQPFVFHFLGR